MNIRSVLCGALGVVLAATAPVGAQQVIPGPPAVSGDPAYQQPGYQQPGYQQPGYQQPPYQAAPVQAQRSTYSVTEIVDEGHRFFGSVSRGLASVVERAVGQWGEPNGYILGQEGGGAIVAGLRYGEGVLYTRLHGERRVFWQGPSIGWDFGGDGARSMILVYNLPSADAIYQRFPGIDGSAYLVGGFGMTAMGAGDMVLVPIRSGVGLRLGANLGYLKFTPNPTWNPF